MQSSKIDPELCLRHRAGALIALMTKHVDDLKLTGEAEMLNLILKELKQVFGELKVEWHVFTNCSRPVCLHEKGAVHQCRTQISDVNQTC